MIPSGSFLYALLTTRVHEGTLCIDGTYSKGFSFRHADGSPYGGVTHPHIAALLADVQSALKNLGVKQRAARAIVETIGPRVGVETTLADAIRMALAIVREGPSANAMGS